MLFIGEKVGTKKGPRSISRFDPLEGTTLCARTCGLHRRHGHGPGGTLLNAPDVTAEIAIGPAIPRASSISTPRGREHRQFAKAKGVKPHEITALVMDRPRHEKLLASLRRSAARCASSPTATSGRHPPAEQNSGIDIYLGIGAAPEGVLAAGALRCVGGQMQGRLVLDTEAKVEARAGVWASRTRSGSTT